jgi:hypothetical protein
VRDTSIFRKGRARGARLGVGLDFSRRFGEYHIMAYDDETITLWVDCIDAQTAKALYVSWFPDGSDELDQAWIPRSVIEDGEDYDIETFECGSPMKIKKWWMQKNGVVGNIPEPGDNDD